MTMRAVWPALGLAVTGSPRVLRHFEAEYGARGIPSSARPIGVELFFAEGDARSFEEVGHLRGRLRTTSWSASIGSPASDELAAGIHVSGAFGLPLIQSLVVEPILSIAFARQGRVLLPAVGIVGEDGVVVVLGGPRAGKSSLAVRALAAGRSILGDDHVIVGADGRGRGFPRRLRIYPDLPATSPSAYAALPAARRVELRLRGAVSRLTRGAIRLPALVPVHELARGAVALYDTDMPTKSVVFLQRSGALEAPELGDVTGTDLVATAARLLEADRAALNAAGSAWERTLIETGLVEREILGRAWASIAARVITVPSIWTASRALDYFEAQLGVAT